jgi:O-antigen/teichoic acid export membrane protein
MTTVRRSIALSFMESYSVLLISFVSSIIIARILTPNDIGVFSIGIAVVGIAHMLRDFGVGQYLIQQKELAADDIRAAFGLTLAFAWVMALAIFALAGPVARLYDAPEIRNVLRVLSVNFLLIPFGSVTMAVLRRRLEFGSLYWIRTSSALVHAVVAVTCAVLGYGYLSLALASTSGIVATVIACALARPKGMPWQPGFRNLKKVLNFGSYVTGGRLASEVGNALPELLIGKVIDIPAVGIFGRAMGLIELFNRAFANAIWNVMLPHFSKVLRDEESIKDSFLASVRLTTAIAWPFFTVLGVLAYPIVRALYGDQWDASVPLVRLLSVAGALGAMFLGYGQLATALGLPRNQARVEVISAVAKTALIGASAFFGLTSVAVALIGSRVLTNQLIYHDLTRLVGIRARDVVASTASALVLSLAAAVGPILAVMAGWGNVFVTLGVGLPLAALGWLAALFATRHQLAREIKAAVTRRRTKDER